MENELYLHSHFSEGPPFCQISMTSHVRNQRRKISVICAYSHHEAAQTATAEGS